MSALPFDDEGYEPVPPGVQPPDEADALTLSDDPGDVDVQVEVPPPLGRTPALDFAAQAFVPDESGGPLMLHGVESYAQWLHKCLVTRRGENPACHPEFGVDVLAEDIMDGGVLDEGRLGEAFDDWTAALLQHPRSSEITDWDFNADDPDDDAVAVSFRAVLEGGEELFVDGLRLPLGGG